jgi:predicted nucleotidyltransferase
VLATNREVEEAILYDSRAMGRHRPASDIDLTLIGPRLTSHALARIDADLDDLLLPWVIDLSSLSAISHEPLLEHIRRVGQVLYPRDPAQPSRLISSAAARPGN